AYGKANFGLRRCENFLTVVHLVKNRLSVGEKRFVRTTTQQIVGKVQLVEDVSSGGAWLDLHIANLAGSYAKFLHLVSPYINLGGGIAPDRWWITRRLERRK